METQKINRPLILGHQAGAYLAMKIALEHPELVRGAVVLNGLLFAPLPSMPPNATIAERVRIMNGSVPAELFPHPSDSKYLSVWLQSAAWFCKSKERQEAIARMNTKTDPIIWWNYFAELATTDLTGPIKGLKVPLLVLPSIYDAGSPDAPKFESVKTALAQWNSVDASNTSLPVTVVKIEDCRTYATEDQPAKLDEAIDNWTMKISRE
jgi:pimeloyl-ACP methyl ester carboxylesterase